MLRTFSSFPKTRQPVSSGTLSALIQLQRQDLLTGLVDVAYGDGSQALLFFNVGSPFVMFFQTEGNWRKVPSSQWSDMFARPDGAAAVVPLGGDALRISLLAMEAGSAQTEAILIRPSGLRAHMAEVKTRDAASLLWVKNEAFQALILIPGRNIPIQDALVFSPSGMATDADAIAQLGKLDDQLLHVSQFEFLEFPSYMREYALRIAFLTLAEPSLKRFEQLAGDTLVESLGQEVNRYAFHQGWKIQFFGNQIQHRQFFRDTTEAATVYRSLFRAIRNYASGVVGAPLAASVVNEGLPLLPAAFRDVFESQNFVAG